ncbi:hypothetical protein B0T24DRAFT_630561 [Lasiosphaeria ovina]|uniref:Uncharacterized protein n=1 Tax=Lasiosphaeria ovina TaxID=92902 RepID=A0AAE0K822_9PEZI|nr:hypothetical protein B0T24DRAFT_630561 [Lasiosphaeria ovina]
MRLRVGVTLSWALSLTWHTVDLWHGQFFLSTVGCVGCTVNASYAFLFGQHRVLNHHTLSTMEVLPGSLTMGQRHEAVGRPRRLGRCLSPCAQASLGRNLAFHRCFI